MDTAIRNKDRKKPQPLSKQVIYLTTSAILFGNISFGCSVTSFAPALDKMAAKFQTTIEDISIVFTLVTIFYCMGTVACGLLSKYINRQFIVILSLCGVASSMFMTPYCQTKIQFLILGGILGFSNGFYGSSQIVWIIEIWQQKAGPYIQAQHFTFSLGTIIPSLVSAPFLVKNYHNHRNVTDSPPVQQSTIHIPFLIIGTLNSLSLLFQLFLFTFYRYHTPPMYANENFDPIADVDVQSPIENDLSENVSLKRQDNANAVGGFSNASLNQQHQVNTVGGVSIRKIQLIAFSMLFIGAYQAMEISTMQFLPIFGQYSDLKLSESAAAYVLTGLQIMFATGRLLGIFVIFKVRPELLIIANLILIITGNSILLMGANSSMTMLWIGSMILGAGFSTMFPSFFTFIEKHLIVSGTVASYTLVFGTTVSAIYPIILGKIIEHQAVILTYTNFASTFVCIIVMFWGYNLTRKTTARER